MNSDLFLVFLVYLLISIVVFLILRQVMCWYWKININISLQEEQIKLQKETIKLLEKLVNPKTDLSTVDVTQVHLKNGENERDPRILSDKEMEEVNSKISFLTKKEVIVIHSLSRVIKRIQKCDFDETRGWIIVKEFEE